MSNIRQMAPSKRFFSEWNAMNLFVVGTVTLCIGVLKFKETNVLISPWLMIGFAGLLYACSWFFWNKGKYSDQRNRKAHQTFTHRNPLAKLPPMRGR